MIPLSRFQTELLEFFRFFAEEENRPPRLDEIALRFGLGEDSARNQVCDLRRKGFLPFEEISTFAFRILNPFAAADASRIPILGMTPAGVPDSCAQETEGFVSIDLARLEVKSAESLFALKVYGDSMIGKCISPGDVAVLDKSRRPRNGNVVAALVDNETTLKTFVISDGQTFLRAENPAYPNIYPTNELQIQGVLIGLIPKQ